MRLLHDPAYLSATIGCIYDCVLDPGRWEAVVAGLADTVGATRAFLGNARAGGTFGPVAVALNLGPLDEVARHAIHNPALPLGLVWPVDRAMVASRELGVETLRASRFHREFLAPRGDRDTVAFVVTREGDAFGHWLLVTPENRGLVTDEEAAGLELVAPHVRRAVELSSVLGGRQVRADAYAAALDRLEAAVMIVEGGGWVSYANPQAADLLDAGTILRSRNNRLQGATPEAAAALRMLASGGEATLTEPGGVEHLLFAVPLPGGGADSPLLLALRAPRALTRNPVAVAARRFGLTPAQVQVLAFLAQGQTPGEVAHTLGVGVATVRTHLAELYRRTGTRGQAELVARALSLASPLQHSTA